MSLQGFGLPLAQSSPHVDVHVWGPTLLGPYSSVCYSLICWNHGIGGGAAPKKSLNLSSSICPRGPGLFYYSLYVVISILLFPLSAVVLNYKNPWKVTAIHLDTGAARPICRSAAHSSHRCSLGELRHSPGLGSFPTKTNQVTPGSPAA